MTLSATSNNGLFWFQCPEGAPECSHGWSEAQPVESISLRSRPEGAKGFRCPFRAVES